MPTTGTTPTTTDVGRYPLRADLDGDFRLDDVAAACGSVTSFPSSARPHLGLARAAVRAQLWRLDHVEEAARAALLTTAVEPPGLRLRPPPAADLADDLADDLAALHAFEVSPLFKPPVDAATGALTPPVAEAWLRLAQHWIGLSSHTGDLRFLNAACKLLGAAWIQYDTARHRQLPGSRRWLELTGLLAMVAHQLDLASEGLGLRLRDRLVVPASSAARSPLDLAMAPDLTASDLPQHAAASVTVLAGANSAGAQRLLRAARAAALPITTVCWYGPAGQDIPAARSGYAAAWYPADDHDYLPAPMAAAPPPSQVVTPNWEAVAATLCDQPSDLIVLLGMPIVPESILQLARLGVINAHNGALPAYRGMDAVGWALLNNDPIVCTLHLATPAVDQGDLLAAEAVPPTPTGGLRARVKTTQLRLLLAATRFVATTGRLPTPTRQADGGRQFYRLHPHLKRLLDAWIGSNTEASNATQRDDPL